jgi:hypothetical protein
LETARLAAMSAARLPAPDARLIALGWATVDLERAVTELAGALGTDRATFADATGSVTLGAGGRVAPAILPGGIALAILEPSTEGRLATTLARHDEGPSVAWYEVPPSATGRAAGPARPGPFGPERLVAGDPPYGPHRFLVVVAPGTISP